MQKPLADKLRPSRLSGFVGQSDIAGKTGIVRELIKNFRKTNFFPSLIFWGPPESGKTTLARIIANEPKRDFHEFSAVNASTKEIQKIISTAEIIGQTLKGVVNVPIVFIDEIHRFNKAQQVKLYEQISKLN